MERAQQGQYLLRRNFGFDRNRGTEESKVSVPMNPINMVDKKEDLWCRHCWDFHAEDTCPTFRRWIKEGMFEDTNEPNDLNFVDAYDFICTLGGKSCFF